MIKFFRTLAFLILSYPATTMAQTSQASLSDTLVANRTNRWMVEGSVQAHSVAGNGSPWVGIAASYKLLDWAQWGVRGYVPASHTVDESTYAIQVFSRLNLARTRVADLFAEINYAQNFYNFLPFGSYGASVGGLTHVTPNVGVGVAGGVELANVVIDSLGLERRNGVFVYPKVALLADFGF